MTEETLMDLVEKLNQRLSPFAKFIGMRVTAAARDRVTAELHVSEHHCNPASVAHGGCLMAVADNLGAIGTVLNLPQGATTTTLESKTNFLRPVPAGTTLHGEATPVHLGRRTMVWQTRLTTDTGKLAAVVTQTQMVLPAEG